MTTHERDFALDKYGYTQADVTLLISRISQGDARIKEDLEFTLREGGGKAFGLRICESIAANFACIPYRMAVPEWRIVKDIKTVREPDYDFILRSSAETEDWLDGRSGTLQSFTSSVSDIIRFEEFKKANELPNVPFVSQQYHPGWGLVVDIGYSTILGKTVMRMASGNERFSSGFVSQGMRGTFTSATEDAEASVGVWEVETGYSVLPTRNFGHKSIYEDNYEGDNIIVKPLFNAVRKAGIDFGVQLELTAHPDNDLVFQLVQVRPTPTKIHRHILTAGSTPEQRLRERIVARSALVNGAFNVTGEAFFFGREGLKSNFYLPERGSTRLGNGRVGIYDERDNFSSFALNYTNAAQIYLGGYLSGSDAQLTPVAMRPNTQHGLMVSGQDNSNYDLLDRHCGMVSLRRSQIDRIKAIAEQSDKPLRLRVVSDGLIAEVLRLIDFV